MTTKGFTVSHARDAPFNGVPHRHGVTFQLVDVLKGWIQALPLQRSQVGDDVLDFLRGEASAGTAGAFTLVEARHAGFRVDAPDVDDAQAQLRRSQHGADAVERGALAAPAREFLVLDAVALEAVGGTALREQRLAACRYARLAGERLRDPVASTL